MGSVVTAARRAAENPSVTHLVIALGDQPHLHLSTLRQVLLACETEPEKIIRPRCQGQPAHPLAIPAGLLAELAATSAATLHDFIGLHQEQVRDLTCFDSGVLLDIDTPDDYAQASLRMVPKSK